MVLKRCVKAPLFFISISIIKVKKQKEKYLKLKGVKTMYDFVKLFKDYGIDYTTKRNRGWV